MKRIKTILAVLAVVNVMVLQYAAEAPGEAKDPHEVDRLIGDLKDTSWQIRWYAASALGEIKEPRAVEPLIAALSDESHGVRKSAPLALREITGKDFGKDPARWQKWWEKNK